MVYLDLLQIESRVEEPPVLDPLVALVVGETIGEQLPQCRELGLLQVPELVGKHVLGEVGVGDGYLGGRPEPREAHLAVLPDGIGEERRDAGGDVVASQRQRPRPGFLVPPALFPEVAGEEAVGTAADALRAQLSLEPPRPPPQPVQQPVEHKAQGTVDQEAPSPRHRGCSCKEESKNHPLDSKYPSDRIG